MSKKNKIRTVLLLWLTLLVSAWFVRNQLWLLLLLSVVGISVSWHIITIKSRSISPEKRTAHERIMTGEKARSSI